MSENSPPPPSAPVGATPASNQNLIIGIVLGVAVILLLFLVINPTTGGTTTAQLKEELQRERDSLKQSLDSKYGPQAIGVQGGIGVNPEALANEISTEANALAGLISEISSTLRNKDIALQNAEDTRQSLNRRINDLQQQLNNLSGSAAEAIALKQKLESSETLLSAANNTIEDLRKRLSQAPESSDFEALRAENSRLQDQLNRLQEQVRLLDPELARLREENQRLRAQLDRSTLFVESADALPAVAQRLFRELERLEGLEPAELQSNYDRIAQTLNARVLRSVNFKTGSSSLSNEQVAQIRNDIATSSNNAFLLVVGYASTTGDFATNRKLSSNRATAVASQVNLGKQNAQEVRAVFLNETQRFSRTNAPANQICEVWEIRP